MHSTATARNIASFLIGLLIAAAFSVVPVNVVKGSRGGSMPITGVTNAPEVIRETRFRFLDLNAEGYISRDEIPEDDLSLKSMYPSLDEDDNGLLSEPEYVLNGKVP